MNAKPKFQGNQSDIKMEHVRSNSIFGLGLEAQYAQWQSREVHQIPHFTFNMARFSLSLLNFRLT